MGITRDQAMTEEQFHYGECARVVGPRGGVTFRCEAWRRNGSTQTWVTRPTDFRIPIKWGLHEYAAITPINSDRFHVAGECPIEELRGL